jgi:hypothetical protein
MFDARVPNEHSLNFSEFNPMPENLNLVVSSSDERIFARFQAKHAITSPIKPVRLISAYGQFDVPFGRLHGIPPIARRRLRSGYTQFPYLAGSYATHLVVHHRCR